MKPYFMMTSAERMLSKSRVSKLWREQPAGIRKRACSQVEDMQWCLLRGEATNHFLSESLIPTVALYKAMQAEGYSAAEAYRKVKTAVHTAMEPTRREWSFLFSIPFVSTYLWRAIPRMLEKRFPTTGWSIQWNIQTDRALNFETTACFYSDFFHIYHCPELTSIFCECNSICNNAIRGIRFSRNETLATSGNRCDFHLERI